MRLSFCICLKIENMNHVAEFESARYDVYAKRVLAPMEKTCVVEQLS